MAAVETGPRPVCTDEGSAVTGVALGCSRNVAVTPACCIAGGTASFMLKRHSVGEAAAGENASINAQERKERFRHTKRDERGGEEGYEVLSKVHG